jgi:glutamine amidotransferase PdxT
VLALSFHPEVTGDTRLHQRFIDRVVARGFRAEAPADQ